MWVWERACRRYPGLVYARISSVPGLPGAPGALISRRPRPTPLGLAASIKTICEPAIYHDSIFPRHSPAALASAHPRNSRHLVVHGGPVDRASASPAMRRGHTPRRPDCPPPTSAGLPVANRRRGKADIRPVCLARRSGNIPGPCSPSRSLLRTVRCTGYEQKKSSYRNSAHTHMSQHIASSIFSGVRGRFICH